MTVAIVGAGITGLACAAELAPGERVEVFDRIPVAGGVHGWRAPETVALHRAALRAGAAMRLGATAVRWDGEALVAVGPDGVQRLPAAALVVATGARPLTRAELGIAGGRPAGVVPAPVACHLAENGLLVGRRPCVVGGGDWAARACHELLAAGAEAVTLLAPDGPSRPLPGGVRVVEGVTPAAVEGGPRVTALLAGDERIACDAVVLAHGLAPLRNVDGAVWEGPGVVYAGSLADPATVAGAREAGARAAAEARGLLGTEAAA
ncbi:MAG TPA: FAD-dependent oxidoreductase [Gaiellales bacterium]|nr:FAD-dependent oxidoreductase [Gaiellales bacterium]